MRESLVSQSMHAKEKKEEERGESPKTEPLNRSHRGGDFSVGSPYSNVRGGRGARRAQVTKRIA